MLHSWVGDRGSGDVSVRDSIGRGGPGLQGASRRVEVEGSILPIKSARWALVSQCEQGGHEVGRSVLSHASDEGKVRQDTKWQGASTRDLFRIGESVNLVFWIGGRFTVSRDDAGRV